MEHTRKSDGPVRAHDGELDRLLEGRRAAGDPRPISESGVRIGVLLGFLEPCTPLVTYAGQRGSAAVPAVLATDLDARHIGDEVVLEFEDGDIGRPIVLARIRAPKARQPGDMPDALRVEADGQRLSLDAKEQITLRCGDASITLTRHGKVLIKGTYVVSDSSGVNRIKGGTVQVN